MIDQPAQDRPAPPTSPQPVLEVTFESSLGDIAAVKWQQVWRSPYVWIVSIGLVSLTVWRELQRPDVGWFARTLFLVVMTAIQFIVLAVVILIISLLTALRFRKQVKGTTTLKLTDRGIAASAHDGYVELDWSVLKGIARRGKRILIRLPSDMTVIIPIRAFTSEQHARAFFAEITSRWRAGRLRSVG